MPVIIDGHNLLLAIQELVEDAESISDVPLYDFKVYEIRDIMLG